MSRIIRRPADSMRHILYSIVIGAAVGNVAFCSDGPQHAKVLSLSTAMDGTHIVFRVAIQRPDDMGTMTVESRPWLTQRTIWPRLATLTATPFWNYPCYLDDRPSGASEPAPKLDRLTFIGRCPTTDSLTMHVRYPLADGSFKELPVELDFARAETLSGELSPRQQWATAQANWFRAVAAHAGDVGGFWTYGAEQTRRKFDLPPSATPPWPFRGVRWTEEQQYAVMSGALAIQESMQLDRMLNTDRDRGERKTPFADIPAVAVKSHPFDEMRGDKEPVHGALAALVPQDHYFLRFRSVARLLELLDFSEQWGGSLLRLMSPVGTDYGTRERTRRQLCLTNDVLARLLGPAVIKEIAVSGSDPYLTNGSDVTVLFHVTAKAAFQAAIDLSFTQARQNDTKAHYDKVTYKGVTIERLVDPDRRVSCHRCWIGDVCVYSNSLVALERTIDTAKGTVPSLAKAGDFKYMRAAVFPLDDGAEDGFLYLSDAFIRRLVGPELRIKEKRRLEAATSLKMLTNAAMFYGYEHGPSQPSFEQLVADRALHADDLYDPEGGVITWDSDAGIARSSTYGTLSFLTPLIEFDSTSATEAEAKAYGEFRDRYQDYWRQYFDPIGIRFKLGKTITVQTCILPLIDSSQYNELVDLAGGEPITIDPSTFGDDTLLRYVMHLNNGSAKNQVSMMLGAFTQTNTTSDWLGDWMTFWIEDTDAFAKLVRREYGPTDDDPDAPDDSVDVFNASIVFGVHTKNKLSLAAFLVALRTMINATAPNTVVFRNLKPYHEVTIVQIAPDPSGPIAQELQSAKEARTEEATEEESGVDEHGPALYYATIDDGFYVSTQASALRKLIDRTLTSANGTAKPKGMQANALAYIAPGAAQRARSTISYYLEQQAREVSWRNLVQVWLLGRCGLLGERPLDEVAQSYLGYKLVGPDGGTYRYDAASGMAVSSIHGSLERPTRLEAAPHGSPLDQLLAQIERVTAGIRFTEHGLASDVEIARR